MTVLKNKHITFSLMLMCLIVISPMAKAQFGNLLGPVSVINIQDIIMCSITGTVSGNNPTSIPPFSNARVELQCGGQTVSSTTTNADGVFSIPTTRLAINLTTLLSPICKIVVTTPLSTCNASLPAVGTLTSRISVAGITVSHGLNTIGLLLANILRE